MLDPSLTTVVSVTELETDGTRNVLPGQMRIRGDCRTFATETSRAVEAAMRRIAENVARAYGCEARLDYESSFIPLVNDPGATAAAVRAARTAVGADNVDDRCNPAAASEDFARFLDHVPGCFRFLGNGSQSKPLHNSAFDFNDAALAHGAGLHVELVRQQLAAA